MKIIVESEQEKQELLAASEHIHNANIDTDIPMVNTLAHLYQKPHLIEIFKLTEKRDEVLSRNYAWEQSLEKGIKLCRRHVHEGDAQTLEDIVQYFRNISNSFYKR